MAIQPAPGWMGISALNETGKNWMGEARVVVRLPFSGWVSEMGNKSKESIIELGYNENFDSNWLIDWMRAQPSDVGVVINVTSQMASRATNMPCLHFPADLNFPYIRLNINPGCFVSGRGGNGGGSWSNSTTGYPGGTGIHNLIGARLQINNQGEIAGGGGGGMGSSSSGLYGPGGGGRPMGGGVLPADMWNPREGHRVNGSKISFQGGRGGNFGEAGMQSWQTNLGNYGTRAAAGAAITGQAPHYINRGAIYGAAF